MIELLGVKIPQLLVDILIFVAGGIVGWLVKIGRIEYRLWREKSINEKDRKNDKIYRPLYNEFHYIANNGLPGQGWNYTTKWEEMDADLKYDANEQIRSQIEEFVEELHHLQDITKEIDGLNNKIKKHAIGVPQDEELEAQFPENMIEEYNQQEIRFRDMDGERRSPIPIGSFLCQYGHIIKGAKSPQDLRTKLLEHPRDVFEYWDEDYPGWHHGIWQLKSHPRLEEVWPLIQEKRERELVKEQERLLDEIETEAAKIRDLLSEKI